MSWTINSNSNVDKSGILHVSAPFLLRVYAYVLCVCACVCVCKCVHACMCVVVLTIIVFHIISYHTKV